MRPRTVTRPPACRASRAIVLGPRRDTRQYLAGYRQGEADAQGAAVRRAYVEGLIAGAEITAGADDQGPPTDEAAEWLYKLGVDAGRAEVLRELDGLDRALNDQGEVAS